MTCGLLAGFFVASAQSRTAYSEFGIGIGTLNYSGDIATTTNTSALLDEMRPAIEVFGARHLNGRFGFGLLTRYGWIHAEDANHSNQQRGISVSTSLLQVNPFVELNLIRFGKYHYQNKFTIFVRLGAGLLAYNPDPKANEVFSSEFDPHPNAYSSFNYSLAGGVKFRVSYNSILSLKLHYNNSTVDDLDGVLHKNPADGGASDVFGGVTVSFSRAVF